MCANSTDWWFMTEDVAGPSNRVTREHGTIKISYTDENGAAFDRLRQRWQGILKDLGDGQAFLSLKVGIDGIAH